MSEFQFVGFRAIDRPLTDEQLEFAESQSSRAEITRWSFTNGYNYGDFRGDTQRLLRSGYDIHLHYANFGVRTVMMRLPAGIPFPKPIWSQYVDGERVAWKQDKKKSSGTLIVSPYLEPGELEDIWEPHAYLDDIVAVRNALVGGDLRTLYAIWLSAAQDSYVDPEEIAEPSVPAGLDSPTHPYQRLLELYDVDPLTLVAAAETALPYPKTADTETIAKRWAKALPVGEVRELLVELLLGDTATTKAAINARIHDESDAPTWPSTPADRTLQQLQYRTSQLREEENARVGAQRQAAAKKAAKRKEQQRQDRMAQMVHEPDRWLKEADKLVAQRGTENYNAAADILADLGEAIGGERGTKIVYQHAAHLAKSYPTLNRLKSSLRKRGLLS